jgi:hypothetical protein
MLGKTRVIVVPVINPGRLTSGPWSGTLGVFGSPPGRGTLVPAGIEAWTVTCAKPNGKLVGTEQIVDDHRQPKVLTACRHGGKRPRP